MRVHYRRSLLLVALLATACTPTAPSGPSGPSGDAPPTGPAPVATARLSPPTDPCAGLPPDLAARLRGPRAATSGQFAMDETTPDDPLVAYDLLACDWSVANPARGANGRPNEMSASVSYAVIDPRRPAACAVAKTVLNRGMERLRDDGHVTVVRDEPVAGHEGYYVFARRESVTGVAAEAEAAVRLANAVVTVRFSGADLRHDPSMPPGFTLETRPVAEKRLRPTVDRLLPAAIELLTRGGATSCD